MRFFVRTTKGHTVIMGRLNYDSMGRPLPHRRNIVVSRNRDLSIEGCETVQSVQRALCLADDAGEGEAFVIGGAQIYELALPFAHRFYRTRVLCAVPGDVFFPDLPLPDFSTRKIDSGEKNDVNEHSFVVELLERNGSPLSYREL